MSENNGIFEPQLRMLRPNLRNLPVMQLPPGYSLRSFQSGDEAVWDKIIRATFGDGRPENDFDRTMKTDPAYRPERVLFITCNGEPVATASAWFEPDYGEESGYVHMVGVSPDHQGKRLGYWISLAVLHHFREEGRTQVVLQTDDFRIPAVKTYLRLGFQPMLVQENQRNRWRNILRKIDPRGDLEEKFMSILHGPIRRLNSPVPLQVPLESAAVGGRGDCQLMGSQVKTVE